LKKQEHRYFHVLDRDTSRRVDKEEWEDRRSLKPMSETAGVTVASMSEEEFVKQSVAPDTVGGHGTLLASDVQPQSKGERR